MNLASDITRDLAGKVAVVTGAGSADEGIGNGRASAIRLAQAGAAVALVEIEEERALLTKQLVEEAGGECSIEVADVSNEDDVERVVASVIERWGRIDVLVNNVGIAGPAGTVETVDLDAWRRCFEVNVTSMVLTSRKIVPHMRSQGGGSIVNVSSVAAVRGMSPAIAYTTTKGAVIHLSESMALAHGSDGIRVNVVVPGFVYTPMVTTQGVDEAARARRAAAGALGTEGTGWDVADAVAYLAGPRSRWITATVLPVDGGLTGAPTNDWPSADNLSVSHSSAASR